MRPLTKKPAEAAAPSLAQLLRQAFTHDAGTYTLRYAREPANIPINPRRYDGPRTN